MIASSALSTLIKQQGFTFDTAVLESLSGYLELLMQWNKAINLVGARTWQDAVQRLIVDSFHLAGFLESLTLARTPLCWDLGAGAGLPGIPLRMIWQDGAYWMVEAREKRALFLSTVLARHPLPDTHIFRGRLERFFETPDGYKADLILSRAFMPWQKLLGLLSGRLHENGLVLLLLNALPDADLPSESSGGPVWGLHAHHSYSVCGQTRHLCAMCQRVAPSR